MSKIIKEKEENIYPIIEEIKKGKIVIVPTDTVYGLICNGLNEKSKERIYRIKKRDFKKPLIGFVDKVEKAEKYIEIEKNFIKDKWPGSNTIIGKSKKDIPFITSKEKKTGIRIPDYQFLLKILEKFEIIASTSANISGEKTPSTISEISEEVRNSVDLIVDGGKTKGRESTIWDISTQPPKLIRGTVLFVCEGNSCRSPMAEHFLKKFVKEKGYKIKVISAGTGVISSGKISDETVEVMKRIGIEIRNFVSKPLNFKIIEESDIIFVMEKHQKYKILSFVPESKNKIFILDVPDPAGKEISHYERIRDIIKEKIENIVLKRIGK